MIAGATVTVVDVDRGVTRTLTTDDAGAYNAPNLTPGKYTVRAEAKGFQRLERQNVVLEVGKEVRVDLTVLPGEQQQTVTVTESIPLVETTNATMGGILENADIADLPLNGRDYQNLMGLRPGVFLQPGGGPWTQSTNGVRPDESVWMVDGVINTNFFDGRSVIGMSSPLTDVASILPIDAIQDFNLMENPKAEYGWKPGAVVNVGIKSGTNTLHGSAYAFGRDAAWDARNYYNIAPQGNSCGLGLAPAPLDPLSNCAKTNTALKQFGGVVGGRIKKDKLFFFAGFEGLRSQIGASYISGVPDTGPIAGAAAPAAANNDLAAIAGVTAQGLKLSPVSLALMGCTPVAAPTVCTGGPGWPTANGTNNFLSATSLTNRSDNGIGKLDWHMNDKSTVSGMFFLNHYNAGGEDHGFLKDAFADQIPIRTLTATTSWVYTPNSTVVNEMRFGYTRTTFNFINNDINVPSNGVGYPINTGVTSAGGFPNIAVGSFFQTGTANNRPQYYSPNPYFDFQDSVSVLKGKHSFKFGGEFTHIEADAAVFVNSRGTINFPGGAAFAGSTGLEDFFAGTPTTGSVLTGNPTLKVTWMNTAGYIQDDWRINPKVIINLGLRYEYASPMRDANNGFGNFDPFLGMVQQGHGIDSLYKGDHRDFEPRIGFAWDVNGKGTTVVRGGSSLIHEGYNLETFMGQFGMFNDPSTSPNTVPTGALLQTGIGPTACIVTNNCPTSGGTGLVSAASYGPAALCFDAPPVGKGIGCGAAGQATVFPAPSCGDGLQFTVAPKTYTNASPCDIMAVDPNLRTPFVWNYNLSITHTFGSNLSLEVGYVGNKGYRLLSFTDINTAPVGSGWCLNNLTAAQVANACSSVAVAVGKPGSAPLGSASALAIDEARPFYTKFPYLGFINNIGNKSYSNYNSLQVSLTKRMSHGLSFNTGYTYGHGFDTGSLNRFGILPQDATTTKADYAVSDFDVRHRLTFTATYDIPGIKGYGQLLEGWELNSIVNFQTAQPWTSWDPTDNFSGTGENVDRWNMTGPGSNISSGKTSIPYCSGFGTAAGPSCSVTTVYGPVAAPSAVTPSLCSSDPLANAATLATAGCYVSFNGQTVITPPALGTFGNMGRNLFRDSGLREWDASVFKNFKFKERFGVQFRIELFNVLNHPTGANPYQSSSFYNAGNLLGAGGAGPAALGFAGATPDIAAGNAIIGSGANRDLQLGLKLTF